jgi:hypothetical protein
MTGLEERLRRDLELVSQRADAGSIRPLRVPPARRRARAVRWLAAVAAVVAVLGVVTGVSLASRSQGHRPAPLQSPVPPEPVGTMPPYYVTLAATYPQNAPWAFVRDSATGAVLTSVHLPALVTSEGSSSPSITAGDDGTYIITVSGQETVGRATRTSTFRMPPTPRYPHGRAITVRGPADVVTVNRYYLLRVAADGRSASLTRLDIPLSPHATDRMALSPDGTMVATAIQVCHAGGCQYTGIQVVTLATGASRTWTTTVRGAPFSVSWAGNGHIAFQWGRGYRLLDVTQPGTNLLASSVPIAGPPAVATGFVPPALVTPDLRAVITSTVQNIPEGNGRDTVVAKIVELDASTGQLLAVLHAVIARDVTTEQDTVQTNVSDLDQTCKVLSLAPTGVHALVQCFGFGRVDGTRFTPLPGVPNPNATTVSGSDYWGTGAW